MLPNVAKVSGWRNKISVSVSVSVKTTMAASNCWAVTAVQLKSGVIQSKTQALQVTNLFKMIFFNVYQNSHKSSIQWAHDSCQ
jgi:hypothetical protein